MYFHKNNVYAVTDNSLLHVARSWQFLCVISLTFACPAITQLARLSRHLVPPTVSLSRAAQK